MKTQVLIWALVGLISLQARGQQYPTPAEADFSIKNFQFTDGSKLDNLNIHYTTVGSPKRNAAGAVTNAILIMHGTSGSGASLLSPLFAGNLFGPGQLLDATQYYII